MLISAEVRWFWRSTTSPDAHQWFCHSGIHPFPPGGGRSRTDHYLRDPQQVELGIKYRDDAARVEVKGLVVLAPETITFGGLRGPIEIWSKWQSKSLKLELPSVITIEKHRWLRKFETGSP